MWHISHFSWIKSMHFIKLISMFSEKTNLSPKITRILLFIFSIDLVPYGSPENYIFSDLEFNIILFIFSVEIFVYNNLWILIKKNAHIISKFLLNFKIYCEWIQNYTFLSNKLFMKLQKKCFNAKCVNHQLE